MSREYDEMEALLRIARDVGIQAQELIECVQRRLIPLKDNRWDDEAVEAARRVRRLRRLGVNLQGIEVIFHMRRQLIRSQLEAQRLQEEMRRAQQIHEWEIARLLRQLARDIGE
ncbi:MAG: hypothetical protein M5U01_01960 [Ardenticatenaceae bacterium]|nr:hypothetical protein [Ardenticatenaceae bacterium]HBY93560.1 hypothetical protein [Chloroflexota bacterium]